MLDIIIALLALIVIGLVVNKFRGKKKDIYPPHQSLNKYIKDIQRQRDEVIKEKKSGKFHPPSSKGLK